MSETINNEQTLLNSYSRIAGKITNVKKPKWFVKLIIKIFIKRYSIPVDDFIVPKNGYKSFNQFFTRKVKLELRNIGQGIVSPSDGNIYDFGNVDNKRRIFVKHKYFKISELVKNNSTNFSSFTVFYLSPSDYHRVHAPFDMNISQITYIPGTLKSVREKTVLKYKDLYCRNERIVISGESEFGKFSVILVGALMVGKIKLSFETSTQSNIKKANFDIKNYENPIKINKGEELGWFEFGSSVIILIEHDYLKDIKFKNNQKVQVGETVFNLSD